jgi:hypothetical protein
MAVFKSPGVYVVEKDITIVNSSKKYNRRLKICRIFTTDSNKNEFLKKNNLFLDEKQTFKYII